MKLTGGFFAECVNLLIIIESRRIVDVVKDFISLTIIAEIDNIMIGAIGDNTVVEDEINSISI